MRALTLLIKQQVVLLSYHLIDRKPISLKFLALPFVLSNGYYVLRLCLEKTDYNLKRPILVRTTSKYHSLPFFLKISWNLQQKDFSADKNNNRRIVSIVVYLFCVLNNHTFTMKNDSHFCKNIQIMIDWLIGLFSTYLNTILKASAKISNETAVNVTGWRMHKKHTCLVANK